LIIGDSPQEFTARREIFPPVLFGITVILLELSPDIICHPTGKFQIYEVAPFTGSHEYVCEVPEQTALDPTIAKGGVDKLTTLTEMLTELDCPQELMALTEILPPLLPGARLILLLVKPDLGAHPGGYSQI
jgi:hypothetical protein